MRLRILHIVEGRIPRHPDSDPTSGVVHVALNLAAEQAEVGHDVTLIGVHSKHVDTEWSGVKVATLPPAPWALIRFGSRVFDFRKHLSLVRFTHRHAFDIVHGHGYSYLRGVRGRRRVVHVHKDPLHLATDAANAASIAAQHVSTMIRFSDARIAVSEFIAMRLRRAGDDSHPHVVQNAVDLEAFARAHVSEHPARLRREWGAGPDDVVFLYSGSITPEKGVLTLARAFERIAERHPHVRLVFAGGSALWGRDPDLAEVSTPSAYESHVRETLGALVAEGRVRFLGLVGRSSMPATMIAADAVCVPSEIHEASGLVVREGMAAAKPVVASAVGAIPELLDSSSGLLVSPGDEDALFEALDRLGQSSDLRSRLGSAGAKKVANRSWRDVADGVENVYRSLEALP